MGVSSTGAEARPWPSYNNMRGRARFPSIVLVGTLALGTADPAAAAVMEFTDRSAWENAVGGFTTIDFSGFPEGTFITDQYAASGVLFTDRNDSINSTPSFLNDGWGLDGNGDVTLSFAKPQAYIGVDFPGALHLNSFA